MEKRLAVKLTIFERTKSGVFGIFVCKSLDCDHSSDFFFVCVDLQAFVAMNSNNLSEL